METAQASSPKNAGVFEGVTAYHWLVFFTAAAGWLFDCMGQRLSMKNYLRERTHGNGTWGTWQAAYTFIGCRPAVLCRRRS